MNYKLMGEAEVDVEQGKIGAISTLIQQLEKITSDKTKVWFFRGHSKSSYHLKPSIYRNRGLIGHEAEMFNELILRCPNEFDEGLSTFQMLVKMQHYSLPTRLLDITSNPLVALYFACDTNRGHDGEVYVMGFDIDDVKYFDSDTVSILSCLSRRPSKFVIPEIEDSLSSENQIVQFNAEHEIKLLTHDIRRDKPHFKPEILPNDLRKVLCVKPKLDNPRIIRQDGAFLLFGIEGSKHVPATLSAGCTLQRMLINSEKKQELMNQLESLGLSQATLFPELEKVATYLTKKYEEPDRKTLKMQQKKIFDLLTNQGPMDKPAIASALGFTSRSTSNFVASLHQNKFVEKLGGGRTVLWKARVFQ